MSTRKERAITLLAAHGAILTLVASQLLSQPIGEDTILLFDNIGAVRGLLVFGLIEFVGAVAAYYALMVAGRPSDLNSPTWAETISGAILSVAIAGLLLVLLVMTAFQ